jgi:N12 class adenine-specific DNA methylase
MAYRIQQKFQDNIDAIRVALEWERSQSLSEKGLQALKLYSGFGGLKAILFPDSSIDEWIKLNASKEDLKLFPQVVELHQLLKAHFNEKQYKGIVSSLKNSVLTAFYTPEVIPDVIYKVLNEQGIKPGRMYEPSSGAGIFITKAATAFPSLEKIEAVEKDILSAKILMVLCSSLKVPVNVQVKGFEDTPNEENGDSDLIVSNIPFGNFRVFDEDYRDEALSGKIHNYFFAKGLDKIKDGGLLIFITTDAFLNSPSNLVARKYVLSRADFISLSVLPDNLMKETGNTEAPNHLLILQKNNNKGRLSSAEELLINTHVLKNESGFYSVNEYIIENPGIKIGDEIKAGTNQYGKAHEVIWQHGAIDGIGDKLHGNVAEGFKKFFKKEKFGVEIKEVMKAGKKHLTCLPVPENNSRHSSLQLGLFDLASAVEMNQAGRYLNNLDERKVKKSSARIINIVKSQEYPDHESIVMLAAKALATNQYVYKLHSNVAEITFSASWIEAFELQENLESLSAQLQNYDQHFYNVGELSYHISTSAKKDVNEIDNLNPMYKEGTMIIDHNRIGFVSFKTVDSGKAVFIEGVYNKKDIGFYHEYILLRDNYLLLTKNEFENKEDKKRLIGELNELYDQFRKNFGALNLRGNHQKILKDEAFGFMILASLEIQEGEHFIKSDVFNKSGIENDEPFLTDDPMEALARSLNNKGLVDIAFMSQATGKTASEVIESLGEHIYLNPANGKWETSDQYLSGNVVSKLSIALSKAVADPKNEQFQRSVDALKKIQPENIPFELLDFNLGERWIPQKYYIRFATDLFEVPVEVNYFRALDTFKVKTRGSNIKTNREFAVTTKSGRTTYGHSLLEHALENTSPFFTYEVELGDKKMRVPDNDAIQMAHQKIEAIRSGFNEWLKELPESDKVALEKLYNSTFNCYVLRKYEGSHLQFPGLDRGRLGINDLYSSQKNSVWRIIQNRGALIDHEVGLGKTLTMVVASHEMRRLGLIEKPMILALKSNVNQIAETYRKAYPSARIIVPGEKDFTPLKRLQLFHQIKNNRWDCIILTHDQFGKIPQSPEIQKQIFEAELDNLEKDLFTLKSVGGDISKRMLRGLEIRKNNLSIKLNSLLKDIEQKKDAGINFKDLGIDHLFVDESHKFKNLTFTTRHDRVAGLGNTEGSQKALNMLFAVRTLQEKFDSDLCVTFLSGTPISNSLTEMYLLFKYLRPREMSRQHIENFDSWASVFARKTVDFEFSVTNEIRAKERFRHFIKVPELALFYNEITDYKTAKHIHLDKPELDEVLINISPTPEQKEFTKNLMEFAKTGNAVLIGRRPLTREEDKGRMLIASNYAKKMAADMRLINPFVYSDHPDNKVNVCARKVAEIYKLTDEQKGTQLVFSDIGTPKPNAFNIYDALKEKLVTDFNIPSRHITFIHEWAQNKKPELFRRMNQGDIRILLGSTDKAGTGLNVQNRVIAIHHLDVPWKPSELEQRNGRGARQGNILAKEAYGNKVKNYVYAVEQSLDNYKFNLLKNKQTFISQIKNCELNVRTIDEGAIDEKSGMNFSEYIAILSGDTSLLEKSKTEKKIAVLESLRGAHFKEILRSKSQLQNLIQAKESAIRTISKLGVDQEKFAGQLFFTKEGSKANPIKLYDLDSADVETIGKYLIQLYKTWKPGTDDGDFKEIGALYGFSLFIKRQREANGGERMFDYHFHNTFYAENKESGIKYFWNQGNINIDNPKLAARYFLNAIDRIGALNEKYNRDLQVMEQNIGGLQNIISKPFDKAEELQMLKKDVARLEREITLKIQANQMKQQESKNEADGKKETPVIQMDSRNYNSVKSLLPQNENVFINRSMKI